MLKVEATLSPQLLRYQMQNIEGFRQVQPLGAFIELTDEETGRTRKITVTFTRTKNTGVVVVMINVYAPNLKEQVIPLGCESAVYLGFLSNPDEICGKLETFIDALQACFIYESQKDIDAHKASMLTHIMGSPIAHIVI